MILHDLEPQKEGFWWFFFAILACNAHFKSKSHRNGCR